MSSPNKEINKFNSKQPATGKMAWTMRVLTTEYLIDGSFDWDKQYFKFDLARDVSSERGVRAFWFKTWTGVQVQPTGNLTTPLQSLPEWTLASGLNVVTIIPNDDACRQAAQRVFNNAQHPLKVVIYAGPYRIRCTFLSSDVTGFNAPNLITEWGLFLILEAEIDSQVPGARLTGLQVPWLLLNGGLVHGITRV
jgi:hypothetical protein